MVGASQLRAFVARSDDRRLERTLGSPLGLRLLFGAMARRFVPAAAEGFEGDLVYELRDAAGRVRCWTVTVEGSRARATSGRPADREPALVVKLATADAVRLGAGQLDAGRAVLDGRLDLEGDFGVAMRLGEMFGR